MRFLAYLLTLFLIGTAVAQNPTILQGNYITNVFGNSNFVLNPNAQTNVLNVAVSNATVTRSTTTPLVATSEANVTVTVANGTIAWSTRTFDAGMRNGNCEARFTYRGFQSTSIAQVRQGATVAGANVVAQLTLTPSATDPRIASINFPCGDLSQPTYFVITDTSTLAGTNEIGGIYVGLATNMANVAQAEVVFRAQDTNGASIAQGTTTTVIYPSVVFDSLGAYNASTGIYTVKKAGRYLVHARVAFGVASYSANSDNYLLLNKNGTSFSNSFWSTVAFTGYPNPQITGVVDLSVGDTVSVSVLQNTGAARNLLGGNALWSEFSISRFPSSSELVVKPETQNVWGAVEYRSSTQSLFSGSAEPTGYSSFNNATWNQPTLLKGKAAVTTTNSGNDLGFSIPNLPVGNYKLEISGQLYAQPGSITVNDLTACTFRIFETTTSTTVAEQVLQAARPTSSTNTTNLTASFQGVFNNTSISTRNFRLEANKTVDTNATNLGTCNAVSSASGNDVATIISFTLTPLDQPSNSALYVQGPVLGAQTGAAISAGYVFEELSGTNSADFSYVANTTANAASITLQPGIYLLDGQVKMTMNTSGDYSTDNFISISETSATYDSANIVREGAVASGGSSRWQRIQRIVRVTTANKVWYLTGTYTAGAGTVRHVNNSQTYIKAYRLN